MTISALIAKLKAYQEDYGDLEVSYGTYYNDLNSDYLELYNPPEYDATTEPHLVIIG